MKRILFMSFIACLLVMGCASGTKTTAVYIKGELNSTEYSTNFDNIYLEWNLEVNAPITQEKNGLMMVQVPLLNDAQVDQSFQYQFRWFDATGVAIKAAQRPYEVVTISGRDTAYAQAVAPTPEARKWECAVRRLNPEER